jgi:hypothetical protein
MRVLVKAATVIVAVLFLSITVLELNAHARAGGSRSSGSSGSRSYSRPAHPSQASHVSRWHRHLTSPSSKVVVL